MPNPLGEWCCRVGEQQSVGCLGAVLTPLLVAELVISTIHPIEVDLEVPLKLLLDDVGWCSAEELFGDGTGRMRLRSGFT